MSASPLSWYGAVMLALSEGNCCHAYGTKLPHNHLLYFMSFLVSKNMCILLKINLHGFQLFLEFILCIYYWHFISSWKQTGVFYTELGYCSLLTVSSVLITNKHGDFTVFLLYARQHSSLLSPTFYAFTMSILVKINVSPLGVHFMYCYCYFVNSWK